MTARLATLAALSLITFSGFVSFGTIAQAEPAYCQVENFKKLERGNNVGYLDRVHVYQLGQLTLAGLGVGNSDARYVQTLAAQYNVKPSQDKSCVFYFNNGNDQAAAVFNHQYVTSPILKGTGVASKYEEVIAPLLDQTATSMLGCAEKENFIAMGCDGMRHRGPSVFAMFLAYSGCTPEHATEIVNAVWGTNHVPTKTRTAIAQKGWESGNRNPAGRARLQRLMTTK